jgi:hypothetical protein
MMIKSRRMKWAGHVACLGHMKKSYKILKTDGKRKLGRPRSRWEYNIKTDLEGREGVDWIHLVQDRNQL